MKKYQKEDPTSYTLGAFPTIELIKNKPESVVWVYLSSKLNNPEEIIALCEKNNLPYEVSDKNIGKLSDKENVYVVGVFKKYEEPLTEGHHVVLVSPANMGNVGTIIRTVLGFGIENLAVIKPAADIFDPKVVRASMGALFQMKIAYYETFADYQKAFPEHLLYPFMLQTEHYLDEMKFVKKPSSLIFGPESSGLDDSYLQVGTPVKIRQSSKIDSFNLQVSVSVACYEFMKNKK